MILSADLFMLGAFRLTRSSIVLPDGMFFKLRCIVLDSCLFYLGFMEMVIVRVSDTSTESVM